MRKFIMLMCLMATLNTTFAQNVKSTGAISDIDWTKSWTEFNPNAASYPEADKIITGEISVNTTLSSDFTYLLKGIVYVTNGAQLTIQPGTIIRCDHENSSALVITNGSSINAVGNKFMPIVFTSNAQRGGRKAGDWGGIIILGDAPINTVSGNAVMEGNLNPSHALYGGTNESHNGGILKYVRIEFPGNKINLTKELNGLSLCGVGNKTIIDHVQVSFSNDDSFEWYGGISNAQNIISFKGADDDFDMTMGFQGTISNVVAIRHPMISDPSGSRTIEMDGYDKSNFSENLKFSKVIVKNATFVCLANKQNEMYLGDAIKISNKGQLELQNAIVSGYRNGAFISDASGLKRSDTPSLVITNSVFNVVGDSFVSDNLSSDELVTWFSLEKYKNMIHDSTNLLHLFMSLDEKDFNFKVKNDASNLASE